MFRNTVLALASLVACSLIGMQPTAQADGMRVVDVPMPTGATDVSVMKRRGDVRFQMPSDFKTVGNYYAKELTAQGWRKSGRDNSQRTFWVQTFAKDSMTLVVRVSSTDGRSEVRLTPTGMMWEEDDQPTPKEIPLPADATEIEYDDFFESIECKSASDVKSVAETLSAELEKIKWQKGATDFNLDSFVRMNFSKKKSTLVIDVRDEDGGSEVAIRTKGMQWDGMKAEIKAAKKQKKAIEEAAEMKRKQEEAARPLELPERKEKPKQGIADLPKLPSEGVIVMDGTKYTLPHVIAYEVFEYDQWSTKIVATRKPIKQDSLLARLKETGTDNDEDEGSLSLPQPNLMVELDDNDQPRRLNLLAGGTPGHGSGDELTGTALVEDGRVRGTVALAEPGDFFDKVYTAELSFDVPLLTRDSTPAKRLSDAPQLANSGTLIIGSKTYKLPNVVCYRMKFFDEPMTTVVLSQKPLDMSKLKAALGKDAADDYFEFTPQIKLVIDADDNVSSLSIWADNISIGSNSDMESDVVIEDGRARGTATMSQPREFLDTEYRFDVSFDVNVLGEDTSRPKPPTGGLPADSYDGLPVPQGHDGFQAEGSRFRKQSQTTVTADLNDVVSFYRLQLNSGAWGKWNESAGDAKIETGHATLAFAGPDGELSVQLDGQGNQTAITLIVRDTQAAKRAGLFPAPGKARLIIANMLEKTGVIKINAREYKINAGAGAEDPKTGLNWEVAPGNYSFEVSPPGQPKESEKLSLKVGEIWGVIIDPSGGLMVNQVY